MKSACSVGLLCLVVLIACGQVHRQDVPISAADSAAIRLYEGQSNFYRGTKPDSAIFFADKGMKLSRNLHYPFGEGLMLSCFARINEQYGNLKLAVKYQQKAVTIFDELHQEDAAADGSAILGIMEAKQGQFVTGLQLVNKAFTYHEKKKDTAGMIRACIKLGEVYELNKNSVKALQYYSKAEELNKGVPLSDEYFSLIGSIGKLYARTGNHRQAATYFEKGLHKSDTQRHIKKHIAFLNHAGRTWDTLGNRQKSLEYHQLALQKAKEAGLHEEEARSLIGIAGSMKNQDANLSIIHLKNALAIAYSIGHKRLSAEIYHSLAEIYRQQSRHREALKALEEHHRLLDSLLKADEGHKINVLQKSYELAESKVHIETLELANRERTYQRNVGILAAAAILIILMILAGYFYKTTRFNRKLEASNLIKDKLFSIIGHDLRNPIGGITQLLAIVDEEELDADERKQLISEMRKQGAVTLEILNALLNWGEAQLKGIHIQPSSFNARDKVSKNIEALRKHTEDKSLTISDNIPEELAIYGDPNHFDFIIRNLLSNAIKFSYPAGMIGITADSQSNPGQVIFSVSDQGKGISKTQQELFLRSNLDVSYGTGGEKGTGIGLMLCKEFIKANGGRIWMESEEGKGTVFHFTFPTAAV